MTPKCSVIRMQLQTWDSKHYKLGSWFGLKAQNDCRLCCVVSSDLNAGLSCTVTTANSLPEDWRPASLECMQAEEENRVIDDKG